MENFIWETHGIHVGTGNDHIKHGVDEIEQITEKAIEAGAPSITFIIHTPRLTRFRYNAETDTDIKFIRGDMAYLDYPNKIAGLKKKYGEQIEIRYGIELEWLGSGLGLQWNRSKIFQVAEADFVIGSVHFSHEGLPYDGSPAETKELMKLRGGSENYWAGYIEEMIEMIDVAGDMIQVVGHVDLPKLYVETPKCLHDIENSSHPLARRMRTLLEMIADHNLVLDVNLAGIKKGCGIYPSLPILKLARKLNISIAIGTDTHHVEHYGHNYDQGIKYPQMAGYSQYVSFSHTVPEKRPLEGVPETTELYRVLNLGIELLNRRFSKRKRRRIPRFSFGGVFRPLIEHYSGAVPLAEKDDAIRIRRETKSITVSNVVPSTFKKRVKGIYSHHVDKPGVLSILFNTLASEEINVETAFLNAHDDGTASAYLTLSGEDAMIEEAVAFVKGTAGSEFLTIDVEEELMIPEPEDGKDYILALDGVELSIPVSPQMIITEHDNSAGVLLVLLSALASKDVNVRDLQLGERGGKGYAILGVEGDKVDISRLTRKLGPQFHEASHIILHGYNRES
jgi:HisJ family histidinol phosphate phosphatase